MVASGMTVRGVLTAEIRLNQSGLGAAVLPPSHFGEQLIKNNCERHK